MRELVVFPPAGGASPGLRQWISLCRSRGWMVQALAYPGHMEALKQPPAASVEALAERFGASLSEGRAGRDRPHRVFLGHSLGGYVAFETALRCVEAGTPPAALALCASRPPLAAATPLSALDDLALISWLESEGADLTPLRLSAELMDIVLGALRRDLRMADDYAALMKARGPLQRLSFPCLTIWGERDTVAHAASSALWAPMFTGRFYTEIIPECGHYPIEMAGRRVLDIIEMRLGS